jgi:glutamyl-tRNA reductase
MVVPGLGGGKAKHLSHHGAPLSLLESVALDPHARTALEAAVLRSEHVSEAVVLSTCNRTELYLAADAAGELEEQADDALRRLAGDGADALGSVAYRLADESAALHLFRVAAGLDSLVPGEGEILGQVRAAFDAGATGALLDRLFRQALHAGRRARAETAIGESPASVPAAAAALAQQVFDRLDGRKVVIVGAGRMSEATARNLRSRGAEIVAVANRTAAHAEEVAQRLGVRAVSLADVAEAIADADVVVASTSAPGFVLDVATLGVPLRGRRGRPLLFVDLAVPRDVDPELAGLDGCFVYDIDDLEAVVEVSLAGRRSEAARAERVVAEEADRFREWQSSLAIVPAIASLRARAEEIRSAELAKVESRLSDDDRRAVDVLTSQIVNKLLHLPTVRLKEAAVTAEGVVYADVVRHLFGLGEEESA